jgi:hypothetical protein
MDQQLQRESRWSRESRLLLLTVAVCAIVLLVLARLRFPEVRPVDTAAPPLERLAARASYDALAADIERVEPMISPSLIILRVAPRIQMMPHDVGSVLIDEVMSSGIRHVAALRIDPDTAIAIIDRDTRLDGIVGGSEGQTAALISIDPIRRVARIRVPREPVPPLSQLRLESLPTPLYVVVVEGTQAGSTVRPVFLGRGDRFGSSRWSRPLLPLGGIAVSRGALLFSLAGEFIGAAVIENGAPAIVGARDLLDTAARLASGPQPSASDAGIAVQALTREIAAATGSQGGVVVSDVFADGPAAMVLEPGDVITAVGTTSIHDPDEFLLRIAARPAGDSAPITFVRNGESRTAILPLRVATENAPTTTPIAFVGARGVGTRVQPGGAAAIPGLQPGDVVTRAGATTAPTPLQLRRMLMEPTTSGFVLLVIRRDGRQRVIAVPVGTPSDAAAR